MDCKLESGVSRVEEVGWDAGSSGVGCLGEEEYINWGGLFYALGG